MSFCREVRTMVTVREVFGAVVKHFEEATGARAVTGELKEPGVRPGVRVFLNSVNTGLYSKRLGSRRFFFGVYYYARDRDRPKAELFDIKDSVAKSFYTPLAIRDDCRVYVDEVEFERLEDGILHIGFEFTLAGVVECPGDKEFMESVQIDFT